MHVAGTPRRESRSNNSVVIEGFRCKRVHIPGHWEPACPQACELWLPIFCTLVYLAGTLDSVLRKKNRCLYFRGVCIEKGLTVSRMERWHHSKLVPFSELRSTLYQFPPHLHTAPRDISQVLDMNGIQRAIPSFWHHTFAMLLLSSSPQNTPFQIPPQSSRKGEREKEREREWEFMCAGVCHVWTT